MKYTLMCESCDNNKICKLKDDNSFTDLCPKNKSKKIIETKQKITHAQRFELINQHPNEEIQEKARELEKRRILRDIEKGRGGPDIAGMKKMQGTQIESKLAKKAKEKLVNSF